MFLRYLRINAFRGLHDLELEGLTRFVVVTGDNGVGKSSLLEAMLLLHAPENISLLVQLQARRGFGTMNRSYGPTLNGVFSDYEKSGIAVIQGGTGKSRQTLEIRREDEVEISDPGTDRATGELIARHTITFRHLREGQEPKVVTAVWEQERGGLFMPMPRKKRANAIMVHPASGRGPDEDDIKRFGVIVNNGNKRELIDTLREFTPELKTIDHLTLEDGRYFVATLKGGKRIPYGLLGAGAVRFLTLSLIMHTVHKGGWIGIDEYESSFHHSRMHDATVALLKRSLEHRQQIVITSHSNEVIQHIANACDSYKKSLLSLVRLYRDEGGKTVAKVYTGSSATRLIRSGLDVR